MTNLFTSLGSFSMTILTDSTHRISTLCKRRPFRTSHMGMCISAMSTMFAHHVGYIISIMISSSMMFTHHVGFISSIMISNMAASGITVFLPMMLFMRVS